jgi:hypothetical protein
MLLSNEPDVTVSRGGPQRRVHNTVDESRIGQVKGLLPSHVIVEEAAQFNTQGLSGFVKRPLV